MAGIGSAAFADPNGAAAQAFSAQQEAPRDVGGGEQASPEEQAAYEQFVKNGLELIYPAGEEAAVAPQIIADLKGEFSPDVAAMFEKAEPALAPGPIDNLAVTTVTVILMLEGSAAEAGKPINHEIEYAAGSEIMGELATVAQAAGIHDYSDKEMEGAWYRGVDLWRVSSPAADQEALSQEFGQVVQADREGRLGEVLPKEAIDHAASGEDEPPQDEEPPEDDDEEDKS